MQPNPAKSAWLIENESNRLWPRFGGTPTASLLRGSRESTFDGKCGVLRRDFKLARLFHVQPLVRGRHSLLGGRSNSLAHWRLILPAGPLEPRPSPLHQRSV